MVGIFRGRIAHPRDGYIPRTLQELRVRRAIGSILNRREWRTKWQLKDVQEEWFQDIESTFIAETLVTDMRNSDTLVVEIGAGLHTPESNRAFISFLQRCLVDKKGEMQSYEQISWIFEMIAYKERFDSATEDELEEMSPFRSGTKPTLARVRTFLIAARAGQVSRDSCGAYIPESTSEELVDTVWVHVSSILKELDQLRTCVINTLRGICLFTSEDAVPVIQETWMSDQLVAPDIKSKFLKEVNDAIDCQRQIGQLRFLVRPSMHCCVNGTTRSAPFFSSDGGGDIAERMLRIAFAPNKPVENPYRQDSVYQWIPSDFKIEENGDVRIVSYINNLEPTKHSAMYDSIAAVFKAFVPMFERVLGCLRSPTGPPHILTYLSLYMREASRAPDHPLIFDILEPTRPFPVFPLRGEMVQVVVKILEIELPPSELFFPASAWHIEGSDGDQIVASGIYVLESENIQEATLDMRAIVKAPAFTHDVSNHAIFAMFGLQRNQPLIQTLGSVSLEEGRCVTFPNTIQYRFGPLRLVDATKPGVYKTLEFSLVDPTKKTPSTSVIPPQNQSWLGELSFRATMPLFNLPYNLPAIAIENVKDFLFKGNRHDDAQAHCDGLLRERLREEELIFSANLLCN